MNIVLETCDLRKEYGTKEATFTVLKNINLSVGKGEFLGIMGPSGAGKTTLLNILSTIDKPTSGEVYYEGKNILNLKNKELSLFRRNNIGLYFKISTFLTA